MITVSAQDISSLPRFGVIRLEKSVTTDWLVQTPSTKASVYRSATGKDIILSNGLVRRTFRITPNIACIDFKNLTSGQQLLRAVKPEARLVINNKRYDIGGLHGQKENAYLLPAWVDGFVAGKEDFSYTGFSVSPITPFLNWKSKTWAVNKKQATGKLLSFTFGSPIPELKGIIVHVNYELYDGIPLIVKWISVDNQRKGGFILNRVVNEVLAVVEEESAVVGTPEQMKKQHGIYVETNYAFNNAMRYDISDQTTHWKTDSVYTSQVNYFLWNTLPAGGLSGESSRH